VLSAVGQGLVHYRKLPSCRWRLCCPIVRLHR
jgi:hypothetical protein